MPRWPYPTPEVDLSLENGEDPLAQPIRVITLVVVLAILASTAVLSPLGAALFFGALALLAAAAAHRYVFQERPERLVLTPEGFRVTRVRGITRRARREVAHRWDAVSAARVAVFRPGYDADGGERRAWLVVTVGGTAAGGEPVAGGEEALRLDTRLTGVDELIEVLGAMTPHLPYRWARADGSFTGVTTRYEQVPRAAAAGD